MSYRLKADEPVSKSIRRVALHEIEEAIGQLRHSKDRDKAIHEARKSLKKLRALLRLVQPELGKVYQAENSRLRKLGRKLSELRDAKATVEIFDSLISGHADQLPQKAFSSIRQGLEKSKQATDRKLNAAQVLRSTSLALTATIRRVAKWPINEDGFAAISDGLKDRYRRGRAAMAAAVENPTAENFHEWRKRVKDHWYHVRLLQDLWKEHNPSREADLHNLETWLGDDHNLAVLRQQIEADRDKFGKPAILEMFFAILEERQKQLRQDAMDLGIKIYKGKPAQMVKEVGKIWKVRVSAASAG